MAKPAVKKNDTPELPDAQEQAQLLSAVRAFAQEPRFAAARQAMTSLHLSPPQSLLLEGGSQTERSNAALYWAALLNCPQVKDSPCLACPVCLRYASKLHRDLFFFDGSAGSIKIDEVREMRAVLGEPPREGKLRVVIFAEGQALGEAAANALLKSLEEPRPGTVFVLTAPQRERLLPTLVSRSWVLTLPWPGSRAFRLPDKPNSDLAGPKQSYPDQSDSNQPGSNQSDSEQSGPGQHNPDDGQTYYQESPAALVSMAVDWARAMLGFASGKGLGWMERTARRGSLDAALAMQVVLLCQACLLESLSGNLSNKSLCPEMSEAFTRLAPASRSILSEALAEAQDSLSYTVNPALVLDWLATRLFFVFSGDARR